MNPDVTLVYLNVYHLCLMGAVKAHSHARCLPHKARWTQGQTGSSGSNALFLFRALRSSAQYMSKLVQRRIRSQQRKAVRGSRRCTSTTQSLTVSSQSPGLIASSKSVVSQ